MSHSTEPSAALPGLCVTLFMAAATAASLAAAPQRALALPRATDALISADAAETPKSAPSPAKPQPPAPAKPAKEAPKVSKFEARHMRHACREKANERGLRGSDRDSFLTKCFFGRRAQRSDRRECAKQAAAQGLDKAAQRDFERECLKRRARGKQPE